MKFKLAKTAGFCFGVNRAIDIVYELPKDKKCCTLGPIIHNKNIVKELEQRNIHAINEFDESKDYDIVVIRSHGVGKDVYTQLKLMNKQIVDATCPFVSKIHNIVREQSSKGDIIFIAGDQFHPEVIGIMGHSTTPCYTFKNIEELNKTIALIPNSKNIHLTLVAQTTFDTSLWKKFNEILKKTYTNLQIFGTICSATALRQKEAMELSKESDVMIVIGDKKSSNTQKLYTIASRECKKTYQIETKDDIDFSIFKDDMLVGITAGASTPDSIIKEVLDKL